MNYELRRILLSVSEQTKSVDTAEREILSLLDESELGVLDAQRPSHGDLLAVGKSHASGADQSEDSEQTSAGTLGKIIDDGNVDLCKCEYYHHCKKYSRRKSQIRCWNKST